MGCDITSMAVVPAAAVVFALAVGLCIVLKPRSKRQAEKAAEGADKIGWKITGIDFTDLSQSGRLCSKWRRLGFP
jgi:hypothetical protein